jgi:hypothetical protein
MAGAAERKYSPGVGAWGDSSQEYVRSITPPTGSRFRTKAAFEAFQFLTQRGKGVTT